MSKSTLSATCMSSRRFCMRSDGLICLVLSVKAATKLSMPISIPKKTPANTSKEGSIKSTGPTFELRSLLIAHGIWTGGIIDPGAENVDIFRPEMVRPITVSSMKNLRGTDAQAAQHEVDDLPWKEIQELRVQAGPTVQ